jgi:hypothetical protein
MPQVGFEPMNTEFERAKTAHALDRAATVIGEYVYYDYEIKSLEFILDISYALKTLKIYPYRV